MAISMVMPSIKNIHSHFFQAPRFIRPSFNHHRPSDRTTSAISFQNPKSHLIELQKLVDEFDPEIPLEKAVTPPSSWYTDPAFFALELHRVFYRGWQAVGHAEQLKYPHDFFTGRLGTVEYLVCKDDNGRVRAFHNVCRHHASLLASGSGKKSCFVCPYHGWTYGLDGALLKATRLKGIQNLDVNDFGLIPLQVATWGPFILLNVDKDSSPHMEVDKDKVAQEWLGSCSNMLSLNIIDDSLSFVCRRVYNVECNWKVFCDNYLDGGYHVPYAHKGLAFGLKLDSYSTKIYETVSVQSCKVGGVSEDNYNGRLGSEAQYAFIYPNFMINRYGPWMDTNLVLPLGPTQCQVVFDYFLETPFKNDEAFIQNSLEDSERVQNEDIVLCEGVQRGLESPAYKFGRYAPTVENAMHHFHCLLHHNLT